MLSVFMNTDNRTNQIALATVILKWVCVCVCVCVCVLFVHMFTNQQDKSERWFCPTATATTTVYTHFRMVEYLIVLLLLYR